MPPAVAVAISAPTAADSRWFLFIVDPPLEADVQSRGLKLYGPSQEQSGKAGHATTSGPAWKWLNSPVPPENVTTPERVERSSTTCPNAVLWPDPSITSSLSSTPGVGSPAAEA